MRLAHHTHETRGVDVDLAETVNRRVTDRRRMGRFVLRDRRLGFERRHRRGTAAALDASLLFLRDHPAALVAVLALANFLSLLDMRLTLVALRGGAAEANPVIGYALGVGPAQAAAVKAGIVVLSSLGIWLLRRRRQALLLAPFAVAVYGAIVLFEVVFLT